MFIFYELTDFVYELGDASEIFLFEEISFININKICFFFSLIWTPSQLFNPVSEIFCILFKSVQLKKWDKIITVLSQIYDLSFSKNLNEIKNGCD